MHSSSFFLFKDGYEICQPNVVQPKYLKFARVVLHKANVANKAYTFKRQLKLLSSMK